MAENFEELAMENYALAAPRMSRDERDAIAAKKVEIVTEQDLFARLADAEEALKFYSVAANYTDHLKARSCGCCSDYEDAAINCDQGDRARAYLRKWNIK